MPSEYDDKDSALVNKIGQALDDRHIMNINDNGETMSFPPPIEDPIFPEVTITYDDIKVKTNREKIRRSAVDKLADEFNRNKYNIIHDKKEKSLTIQCKNQKSPGVTAFNSLEELVKANNSTIDSFKDDKDWYIENGEDLKIYHPLRDPLN